MKCIFCCSLLTPGVRQITDGGRLTLCDACCDKLAENGFLNCVDDKIELQKPLKDILVGYSSL